MVLWSVGMSRQGQRIARQFFARTYGSEKRALDMALLFRDAVLRLLPPLTALQRIRRPRITTEGIPGVRLVHYETGKPKAWVATCRIPDDCIDSKRYPLFMARDVMRVLIEQLQAEGATPS